MNFKEIVHLEGSDYGFAGNDEYWAVGTVDAESKHLNILYIAKQKEKRLELLECVKERETFDEKTPATKLIAIYSDGNGYHLMRINYQSEWPHIDSKYKIYRIKNGIYQIFYREWNQQYNVLCDFRESEHKVFRLNDLRIADKYPTSVFFERVIIDGEESDKVLKATLTYEGIDTIMLLINIESNIFLYPFIYSEGLEKQIQLPTEKYSCYYTIRKELAQTEYAKWFEEQVNKNENNKNLGKESFQTIISRELKKQDRK